MNRPEERFSVRLLLRLNRSAVHTHAMSESQTLSEYVAGEIRATLARQRKSGRQLANALGASQTWVSSRLNGTTPIDLNDLARIAEALGIYAADLLPRSTEGRLITTASNRHQAPPAPNGRSGNQPERPARTGHPSRTQAEESTRRPSRLRPSGNR